MMKVSLQPAVFGVSVLVLSIASTTTTGQGFRGPEWVEGAQNTGDAGSLPLDAQMTMGKGPMQGIRGSLDFGVNGFDFEDMYVITITEPTEFRVSTLFNDGGSAGFDTTLWLFATFPGGDRLGFGLLANDDFSKNDNGSFITQFSTDNSGAFVEEPGIYFLAITRAGNVPLGDGGEIFRFDDPFEISGPDGPGGGSPIFGWSGDGDSTGGGEYRIDIVGVGFADVPTPGVLPVLIIGMLATSRRRRARA